MLPGLKVKVTPDLPTILSNGKARKIYIVEGGYCNDTRYLEKLQQKELQRSALESALTDMM